MFLNPEPAERIPGGSRMLWSMGFVPLLIVGYALGRFAAFQVVPGGDPVGSLSDLVVTTAVMMAIYVPLAFVYIAAVPAPADCLVLNPAGIRFEIAGVVRPKLRNKPIPTKRLRLVGNRLFVLPSGFGLAYPISLTPYQAQRLRYVVPGIGS